MRDKISKLYFPASLPRHRHAARWRRLLGYGEVPLLDMPGKLKVARYAFPAAVPAAAGKKVLFFADLHCGPRTAALADELESKVEALAPDLLLCGGDLTAGAVDLDLLPPLLKRLSEHVENCIAIPGNWERGKSWLPQEFWHDFFARSGWHYLCNEGMCIGDWGWIYGCDEMFQGAPGIMDDAPAGREKVALIHRPDTVVFLDWRDELEGYDLALCGHSHGGQIRLPFVGPLTASSFYRRKFDCGLFGREGSELRMLISSGVNHASFPWRFNCRREIVLLEFERH